MEYSNLTGMQLDVLREVGNIGAGNAATSMSILLNRKIDMNVPSVSIVDYNDMMDIIGGPEELIVALLFQIEGEFPCTVYFILSIEEAENLIQNLTDNKNFTLMNDLSHDELAMSALKETGNIVIGSYLSALSDFIKCHLHPSIPYLSVDMAGATLTAGLVEISEVSDYAIVINTSIVSDSTENVQGHFFLLPEPDSIDRIFEALGIEND
ncbi:chemotaxis protein CheC [Oceanobacillus sp. Castelsardo]|uniref:chemotaxis protein CheC n=1 Tax=Oceanobacillus sp. Castelsardo TaxID=1851204 RepID=UPI000838EB73|nr:chemotaxis protein CheC [Oceanobacillus sp. Castelsardo]